MDMSKYRDLFLSETREHLNEMSRLLVELEQNPANRETIDALFRSAHSIKGMAASMAFDQTTRLAHHLEDFLDEFRRTGEVPAAAVDYLLEGVDLLEDLLDDLTNDRAEREVEPFLDKTPGETEESGDEAEPTPADDEAIPLLAIEADEDVPDQPAADAASAEPEPEAFQVTVELAKNTSVAAARGLLILRELEKCGEVLSHRPGKEELRGGAPCQQIQAWIRTSLTKDHLDSALSAIADVQKVSFVDDRRKEGARDDAARTIRIRTDLLDQFVNLTGELITHRYMLQTAAAGRSWDDMDTALTSTSRLVESLHHQVLLARLMPLESVTGRLPRIVRDLSRKSGKQVTYRLVGGNVGLDRVILEEIADPLMHLVRNAVDHGIVDQGEVLVTARREKDLVLIEVVDDGRGMDPDRLRQRAVDRGLLTPAQAETLSERDALMLVCQPGFSTLDQVTETSGRGVGMDVVKAAVERLGGSLEIKSAPGKGTRFQMRLPLSIAIIKILLVSCASHPLAIPITRVQRTLDLCSADIQKSSGRRVCRIEEEVISLISLTEVLGLPPVPPGETTWVILTEVQGRRIGLEVDAFLGQRDAFVKSLDFPLNAIDGLSGATVEGDGSVLFILDPQTLLENHPAFLAVA